MSKKTGCLFLIILLFTLSGCGMPSNRNNINQGQNEQHTLSALQQMPPFELKDLNGNEVSNEILATKQITMINIWGTFCGPCIDEMPDLQVLYQEMKGSGVNIIGVVSDGMGNEDQARQIAQEQGATYSNLIPDQAFMDEFVSRTDVVPVSILLNSQGKRVGEVIAGSRSKEEYREIIKRALAE